MTITGIRKLYENHVLSNTYRLVCFVDSHNTEVSHNCLTDYLITTRYSWLYHRYVQCINMHCIYLDILV